jgi:hypothetical protein
VTPFHHLSGDSHINRSFRAGPITASRTLQKGGLVSYRRGNIKITHVEAMRSCACECYEKVRSHYERMLSKYG